MRSPTLSIDYNLDQNSERTLDFSRARSPSGHEETTPRRFTTDLPEAM